MAAERARRRELRDQLVILRVAQAEQKHFRDYLRSLDDR